MRRSHLLQDAFDSFAQIQQLVNFRRHFKFEFIGEPVGVAPCPRVACMYPVAAAVCKWLCVCVCVCVRLMFFLGIVFLLAMGQLTPTHQSNDPCVWRIFPVQLSSQLRTPLSLSLSLSLSHTHTRRPSTQEAWRASGSRASSTRCLT